MSGGGVRVALVAREDDMVGVMGRCGRPGKRPSGMRTRRVTAVLALTQRKRTGPITSWALWAQGGDALRGGAQWRLMCP